MKRVPIDDDSVVIVIKPYGDNKFACGLHSNYKQDTEDKVMCYTVAMGLCQIALDDPDMVYEIGLSVAEIEKKKKETKTNGNDNVLHISEWRKKLN
jgi:hypothetical protein